MSSPPCPVTVVSIIKAKLGESAYREPLFALKLIHFQLSMFRRATVSGQHLLISYGLKNVQKYSTPQLLLKYNGRGLILTFKKLIKSKLNKKKKSEKINVLLFIEEIRI